jgi:hypothetical protein
MTYQVCKINYAATVNTKMPVGVELGQNICFSNALYRHLQSTEYRQLGLDNGILSDIIIYTHDKARFDAATQAKSRQNSSASPTRSSQSPSRCRHGSAVPKRRLLRSSGFGSGQIRNAATCRGRQSDRDRGRSCFRAFTPGLLPGPECCCPAGIGRVDSPQTWSPWRAQADVHRYGFRAARMRAIAGADDRRTDHTGPTTIWSRGASADPGTASGSAEKKTPLIPAAIDTPPRLDLTNLYEQLRQRVLAGGRGAHGYAVFHRHGMKSWIETCLRVYSSRLRVCPPCDSRPIAAQIPLESEVVQLMAGMVLKIHQQGATQ